MFEYFSANVFDHVHQIQWSFGDTSSQADLVVYFVADGAADISHFDVDWLVLAFDVLRTLD